MVTYPHKNGFTLIELMIVVAIIGVIAAIAYPNYQESVKKTKRGDMMATLQNIASDIQSQKLAKGNYEAVTTSTLIGDYPKQGSNKLYNVTLTPSPLTENWQITATPIAAGQMATDGDLTLDATGIKCRNLDTTKKYCGTSAEWNK